MMGILKFIDFKELDKWYVSYYINPHKIQSLFNLIRLSEIIYPQKHKISKKDYDNQTDVVAKISFNDGKIHIRPERKTGMDLYFVPKNSLLVSKINFHQGALAINKIGDLVCSTHYQPYELINNNVNPDYLVMVLRASKFQEYLSFLRADSIKNEATFEFIKELKIPLPSIDIQKSLISAYQDKIRQAENLENQANFEFSGYLDEILGIQKSQKEIPNGILLFTQFKKLNKWGVNTILHKKTEFNQKFPIRKIDDLCKVSSGGTPSRSRPDYYQGNIAWVKTGEVVNDVILETEEYITEQAILNSSAKLYPAGSLVIAMYGQGLTRGRTAKLGIDATTNQACAVLSEIKNDIILTDYLWVYLMNEYERLRELASGNNQPNLNAEMIKNYPVIIPNKDIQKKIIDDFFNKKQQQKQAKIQAQILRKQAIAEFEEAIFI